MKKVQLLSLVLQDVIDHVTPDRAYESLYPQLSSVLTKILTHIRDYRVLFGSENFLKYMDLFQKESYKLEVCSAILTAYLRCNHEFTDDPVQVGVCMHLCRSLHDAINALTLDDERPPPRF